MAELNPYESPKIVPGKELPIGAAKKAVGFMTLAMLTPIAVWIAGFIGCLAISPAIKAVEGGRAFNDPQYPFIAMQVVGSGVFLVPPIVVLVVMGCWAIRAYNREVEERNKKLEDPP